MAVLFLVALFYTAEPMSRALTGAGRPCIPDWIGVQIGVQQLCLSLRKIPGQTVYEIMHFHMSVELLLV